MLSWLSWPPSGCLGPVPLALRGRSEGPASLAHGIAFSVLLVTAPFFHDLRFSSLRGGSKGGPGTILEHLYDPPEAQNGPLEAPFSVTSTPRNNLNVISVDLKGNGSMGFTFF